MSNGNRAVVLLNRGTTTFEYNVPMKDVELSAGGHAARDVWAHANVRLADPIHATLAGHSVAMYVVKK